MKSKLLVVCCVGLFCSGSALAAETISALGRVIPKSGVVDVRGVRGDSVRKILLREGDAVTAGQSLAELSSHQDALAAVTRAESELKSAQQSRAESLGVAKARVELAAVQAKIAAERLARIQSAKDSEFISPDQIEERTIAVQTNQLKLQEAKQAQTAAARDADKAVQAAESGLAAARQQLAASEVRAPIAGRVLKAMTFVGAEVSDAPLFMIGDTSEMIVKTEVYEADALKLKAGQQVTISSASLPKKMKGTITGVSQVIYRNSLQRMDPNESTSSHIVEVTVRMDEVAPLDRLVFLQVDAVISL
jgi:HlyD family secretion protein